MKINAYHLGILDYQSAANLQTSLAARIASGEYPPALLLLEHPHVYTFGRQGSRANLLWDEAELARRGISLHDSDRGGDVTYHGPGQLVGYPLLPLAELGTLAYLRRLEEVILRTLAGYSVTAVRVPGQTGVWVPAREQAAPPAKIASIGVRVDARRITRHGFALNVDPDMRYWQGIIACGLENQSQTSLAGLLPDPPGMQAVTRDITAAFSQVFAVEVESGDPALLKPEWFDTQGKNL